MIPGLVSIVMPAHNCEATLPDSIASVISQSFTNWELIVVDDASSDATFRKTQELSRTEPRIRVFRQPRNYGVAQARNAGMREARGQFLAFLDSDDLWVPHKLERQVALMREHDLSFTFAQYRRLLPNGHLGAIIPVPKQINYQDLLKGNVIGCLTVMIDRTKIPFFSMIDVGHEDFVAWLQILKAGVTAWGIQEDLARYRVSVASISGKKWRSAIWTWNIYRKIEGLSLLKSIWYFLAYSSRSFRIRAEVLLHRTGATTHRTVASRGNNAVRESKQEHRSTRADA
jgi:teichuronic acid biosynthesis glycosyltransferase TuaG